MLNPDYIATFSLNDSFIESTKDERQPAPLTVCMQVGQDGEGTVVTQFHMADWPEHGRPASTASVFELLDVVTKAQMNSGTKPITILCK